jgi:hypothetical protein
MSSFGWIGVDGAMCFDGDAAWIDGERDNWNAYETVNEKGGDHPPNLLLTF